MWTCLTARRRKTQRVMTWSRHKKKIRNNSNSWCYKITWLSLHETINLWTTHARSEDQLNKDSTASMKRRLAMRRRKKQSSVWKSLASLNSLIIPIWSKSSLELMASRTPWSLKAIGLLSLSLNRSSSSSKQLLINKMQANATTMTKISGMQSHSKRGLASTMLRPLIRLRCRDDVLLI